MSDPIDSAGGPGGIIGAILGALTVLGGLWRVVFGTRKERTDASERAAEIALRAAEYADERAERADEETASHKAARGTCEEQLRAMGKRIDRMEREHSACGPRIDDLERQVERLTMQSTPPMRYTGDDVRAAMTAEETGP